MWMWMKSFKENGNAILREGALAMGHTDYSDKMHLWKYL